MYAEGELEDIGEKQGNQTREILVELRGDETQITHGFQIYFILCHLKNTGQDSLDWLNDPQLDKQLI